MYAIIATGGKQYKVSEGDVIKVEKLDAEVGAKVTFDNVLLVGGDTVKVGTPTVDGAKVEASVVSEGKGKKVIVYKYKRKTGYHKKNGHRQLFTQVMTKITFYQRVDGTFQGFHSQDHAGYSAEGQDIVCAAVSALVINFVNSLDELTDDHYQIDVNQEDAEIDVVFTEELSEEGSLLLRSLILGLTSVEEEHGQYLDVIFKEV